MYLPTDSLYAEAARVPGLIDDIGRLQVIVMGPSLLPALLRTVRLGYVTLALEEKAGQIGRLLGATRQEMLRMDDVLEKLARGAGTMSRTIEDARRRTRAVGRKLRDVELLDPAESEQILALPDNEEASWNESSAEAQPVL
jgi:DNA recombination protein RmuC